MLFLSKINYNLCKEKRKRNMRLLSATINKTTNASRGRTFSANPSKQGKLARLTSAVPNRTVTSAIRNKRNVTSAVPNRGNLRSAGPNQRMIQTANNFKKEKDNYKKGKEREIDLLFNQSNLQDQGKYSFKSKFKKILLTN